MASRRPVRRDAEPCYRATVLPRGSVNPKLLRPPSVLLWRAGMRPPRPSVALALVAATLGCGTVESVSRPPSPAELARIDEASKATGGLTVLYVQPVYACASEPCFYHRAPRRPSIDFARLASMDARSITVESEIGRPTTIPLSEVRGVAVTGGRGRSAAIGAGILGVTVFVVTAVLLAVEAASLARASDGGDFGTDASRTAAAFVLGLGGAVVGAGFGYAIGSSKGSSIFFSFDPQPKP